MEINSENGLFRGLRMKYKATILLVKCLLLGIWLGIANAQSDPDTLVKETVEDILETV